MAPSGKRVLISLSVLWVLGVAAGMTILMTYAGTAGQSGATPVIWPSEMAIPHSTNHPTLLMFVHPRCPCSRASMSELARIMAQLDDRIDARVLFFQPSDRPADWSKTDLRDFADRIPGVRVASDRNCKMAAVFGAQTSGHVLLYDTDGHLLFSGGITAGRGHEGDNVGAEAVIALALGHDHEPRVCPVYGCQMTSLNQNVRTD